MSLKIRSRSLKSNQLFPYFQQFIYTSLVKIHPPVQKIVCKKADFYSLYRIVTLKIRSRSPTYNQLLYCATRKQYVELGQNPLFSSRDNMGKPYFGQNLKFQSTGVTLKIRSRSPKSKQLNWLIYTVSIDTPVTGSHELVDCTCSCRNCG